MPSTSTSTPLPPLFFRFPRHRIPRQFRLRRRKSTSILIRNHSDEGNILDRFLSHISHPSLNSLSITALSFASGLALSLPSLNFTPRGSRFGEWILFTSPTPFNRFVLLRCPSVSFDGADLLEDIDNKLVNDERHYIRLHRGRIPPRSGVGTEKSELEYSRVCVRTDDGGVIALDWPSNLDLNEEHGLDSTVLLVPGSAEGSSDQNLKDFVCQCLNRGLFPVVMNPRGCSGSPLTTARLFTAADSDDVSSVIQYLSRKRPWSTFMAVGWGFGANMLTKYLAEVGEKTPLTAATCIDNPFDLEEVTKTSYYRDAVDRKLIRGLINILKSNKGLFQGRSKGFDVETALSAKSVRDFDTAISMISHRCETIEEFYSKSSTRLMVGSIKVPVLFIQSDDGSVPLFSIPREEIAENMFTSLLLCSSLPSNAKSVIMWSQELTIEWLMAVELALLKGRHPLLKDVDVTLNPSKGLAIAEGWISESDEKLDSAVNLQRESDGSNGYLLKPIIKDILQDGYDSEMQLARKDTFEIQDGDYRQVNGSANVESSPDAVEVEGDRGQVLQTAKVVMNMLDVTMPGTLSQEDKKKALAAVDQGETLIKALQDAVPEEVRGKVSDILQAQGKNLNFDVLRIGQIANMSSELKVKINGNLKRRPDDGNGDTSTHSSEITSCPHDSSDSSSNNKASVDKSSGESDDTVLSQEKAVKSFDSDESQSANSDVSSVKVDDYAPLSQSTNNDVSSAKEEERVPLSQSDDNGRAECTTAANQHEKPPGSSKDKISELDAKENNVAEEVNSPDSSSDQNETGFPTNGSEGDLLSHQNSLDSQQLEEKQDCETKNADERSVPINLDQNKPSSDNKASTFNVSQALDALTGLDDSTQVAVNSVFGVIEEMVNQYEEKKEEDKTAKEGSGQEELRSSLDIPSIDKNENHSGVQSNTNGISDEGMIQQSAKIAGRKPVLKYPGKYAKINDLYLLMANKAYADVVYNGHLQKFVQSNVKKGSNKHLDLDTTTSLFLDYIPEEGHWKLLEQPGINMDDSGHSKDEFMESSYIILDSDKRHAPLKDLEKMNKLSGGLLTKSRSRLDDLTRLVKNIVLDAIHVEVSRKLIGIDAEEMETPLARDMEEVANAVALAVRHDTEHNWCLNSDVNCTLQQGSGFDGTHIIETISSAVKNTDYLRRIVPVGVVVGSSLASLKKFFNVASVRREFHNEALNLDEDDVESMKLKTQLVARDVAKVPESEGDEFCSSKEPIPSIDTVIETVGKKDEKTSGGGGMSRETMMVGAVTAALGASALFQEHKELDEVAARDETPSKSLEKMKYPNKSHAVKLEEAAEDKHQNMVVSLAEKAMSVAAPVVPTKEDGEVDQARLVSMLAELGQKGGVLKLVGKLALLWGGIRGAMSLTNKLIAFLQIADRPLIQRILAFGCMILILWSPVAVPFLPTLLQNWATKSSSRIAEFVCTFGLYTSIAILIVLWGKRIRGYENPLQHYGLDLTSSENVQDLLLGLLGGFMLVLSIHSVNASFGFVDLSWPLSLISSPVDHTMKFQSWLKLVFLAGQGLVTAIAIASVEELFFRSWLAEEIAIDLGDHRGIILSGLAFSICQSSLLAIPGLWLLSLCLAGARRKKQGSLYSPIGLHAGIMASCFVLQKGGFLMYRPNLPLWMTGTHPFQPFSGIVGLVFSLLLALILYPRHPSLGKEMPAPFQE